MIMANEPGPKFGGAWTTMKLNLLKRYLKSYTTALKNQGFTLIYIDAFAGTGYRNLRSEKPDDGSVSQSVFADLVSSDSQEFMDGSARIALETKPGFNNFVFIEKKAQYCKVLETLKDEYPEHSDCIEVLEGDANEKVKHICQNLAHSERAVCFLDPYGMQVEWSTIETIAKTKRIDLWVLFPLGVAVNRLLTNTGEIVASHQERLTTIYGTDEWYKALYKERSETDLFGEERRVVIKQSMDVMGKLYVSRLKEAFAWVPDQPAVLINSVGNPLYWMCFAVGNEKGQKLAERIAGHLLRNLAKW